MTDIEWTSRTWNPIVGCTRVSPGCENCYAERFVHRGLSKQHRGLTVLGKGEKGPRWTGEVRVVETRIEEPLSWRKPARVFVNSLSDLFHEGLKLDDVARIFAVMVEATQHTFQILTKRPERMHALLSSAAFWAQVDVAWCEFFAADRTSGHHDVVANDLSRHFLENVWLGVTAEDQRRADERIPILLDTPAAVRFVSYEPALGPVRFRDEWLHMGRCLAIGPEPERFRCGLPSGHEGDDGHPHHALVPSGAPWFGRPALDWVICGGESGPKARPFNVAWMKSAIDQCRAAGVAVFAKQLGAHVITRNDDNFTIEDDPPDPDFPHWPMHLEHEDRIEHDPTQQYQGAPVRLRLRHKKGSDMNEWRSDLRVREFPR